METLAIQRENIFKNLKDKSGKDDSPFSPSKTHNTKFPAYRKSRILSFKKIEEKQISSISSQRPSEITLLLNEQSEILQNDSNTPIKSSKLEIPLKVAAAHLLETRKNNLITIDSNNGFKNSSISIEKKIKSPDFPRTVSKKQEFRKQKESVFRKTFCSSSNYQYKNQSLEMKNVEIRPPTTQIENYRPSTRIRKVSNIGDESNNNFLAKYEIIKELGKGTYGTVHLAKILKNTGQKMMNKTCFFNSLKLISHESESLDTFEKPTSCVFEQRSNQYINLENNDKGNNDLVNNFQDPHKKEEENLNQEDLPLSFCKNEYKNILTQNNSKREAAYEDQELVAIKVYEKFKMNKDPAKFKNIRKEITIMQNLSHEGIIKLYESVESITKISLVVEFGGDLSLLDYLRKKFPLPKEKLKNFTKQLLETIVYLHEKNIVHRDIKPQNILVKIDSKNETTEKLKLIDFGFSTLSKFLCKLANKSRKLNVICGTPNFMAPELLSSKEYFGEKADVWSFGVVVFVMAEGRHPFKSKDYQELSRLVNKGKYTFKQKHDQLFEQFIAQILKINGEERPSAAQILKNKWLQEI